MTPKFGKCVNPYHKNGAKAVSKRGLCSECHRTAAYLVTHKKTTWDRLERDGKCAPSGRKPAIPMQWFASSIHEQEDS